MLSLGSAACGAAERGFALPEYGISSRGPASAQILEPGRAPGA